jgi:O-antigen/teichoic acid export membrane protein
MAATSPKSVGEARHHKVVSNIFSNWGSNIVGAVGGFLLAPVMVHRLGDAGYGFWAFGMQLSTYLSLMDLGLRSSVVRFLTHHHTRGERDQINGVVSVAVVLLSSLAILCVIVSVFAAAFLPHMIKIPPQMLTAAKWTVLLISWTVALTFPGALFTGAIASLSRYDLLNVRYTVTIIVRCLLTWLVLVRGGRIVAIALVWFMVSAVSLACDFVMANRLYGGFEFRLDRHSYKPIAKKLFAFSVYAFLVGISARLVLWSDNVVIAIILGPIAVTLYAIGANLLDIARGALNAITMVFVPLATSYDAKGDMAALRRLLVRGSRMGLLVILPGLLAFFVVGRDFIGLWMGARYEAVAGTVTILLSVAVLFAPLQATSNQILYGMNRHQLYARITIIEALVNLGLSIFLAYRIGVVGVAWGTMVPAVIVEGIFVPVYTARQVQQSIGGLYWQAWIKPLLLGSPYMLWLIVLHRAGWTNSWHGFVAAIISGLLIYLGITWFLGLSEQDRQMLRQRIRSSMSLPVQESSYETSR